ncbi:histidine kinase, partial [Streptococcus sp. 19428wA2_WM07]|nr:histidine kinase [Streptococcus sp. 19428wA2_WM07]
RADEVALRTPDDLASVSVTGAPLEVQPLLQAINRLFVRVRQTREQEQRFTADAAHELRTPLSAILGWAQVLRRGTRDQADLHRGLQSIERNARAQAQLIEDLLDMNRITSDKVLLDLQPLAPASVIASAVET